MIQDIRTKSQLTHDDVLGLNFIRHLKQYVFRRHFRQGLRSHIMEMITRTDMDREKKGLDQGGVKIFPCAKPIKMLRIFRASFNDTDGALEEIGKVKLLENHLGSQYYAISQEFLVHYSVSNQMDILLCGLQEYVQGLILDPWGILDLGYLVKNLQSQGVIKKGRHPDQSGPLVHTIGENTRQFINRIKRMIDKTGYIPDLAGEGNLILTGRGYIKLVDINNMSRVSHDSHIHIDNKGYPVTDKSVEALFLMEKNLPDSTLDINEKLYKTYLDPKRKLDVRAIEKEFFSTP